MNLGKKIKYKTTSTTQSGVRGIVNNYKKVIELGKGGVL